MVLQSIKLGLSFFFVHLPAMVVTYSALNSYVGYSEMNPIAKYLFARIGILKTMVLMCFVTVIILMLIYDYYKNENHKDKEIIFNALMLGLAFVAFDSIHDLVLVYG